MGYACPVCAAPHPDAEHLANHLAFTAMLHGGAHGDWLDEHAPGWADEGAAALAERVAPLAPEATHETVFEDTAHDHDPGRPSVDLDGPDGQGGSGAPDETTRAAVAEAREMTRRMRGDGAVGSDDGDASADGDGGEGDDGDGGEGDDGDGGDDRTGGGDDRDEATGSDGTADGDADEKA